MIGNSCIGLSSATVQYQGFCGRDGQQEQVTYLTQHVMELSSALAIALSTQGNYQTERNFSLHVSQYQLCLFALQIKLQTPFSRSNIPAKSRCVCVHSIDCSHTCHGDNRISASQVSKSPPESSHTVSSDPKYSAWVSVISANASVIHCPLAGEPFPHVSTSFMESSRPTYGCCSLESIWQFTLRCWPATTRQFALVLNQTAMMFALREVSLLTRSGFF